MSSNAVSRRRFLRYGIEAVMAAGAVGGASLLARDGVYVRPPGAGPDFHRSCIRCGACIEVCPEHALKQLDLSFDFFNLGTPVLDCKRAGCIAWGKTPSAKHKPACTACMDVCPSKALDAKRFGPSLGSVHIEEKKCINCMECFKVCPVPGALLFPNPEGAPFSDYRKIPVLIRYETSNLKPYVNNELCVGCGRCAAICPPLIIEVESEKK